MQALIALRAAHEAAVADVPVVAYDELCVLFRVGGSSGSFGPDAIGGVYTADRAIVCEVILEARDWDAVGREAIDSLLTSQYKSALKAIIESEYGSGLSEALAT